MRNLLFLISLFFVGCMEKKEAANSVVKERVFTDTVTALPKRPEQTEPVYENARFRKVVVKKMGENAYRVTGEGQIFEASFNWIVEDGHNELDSGYVMTDAGAPAWGKFDFRFNTLPSRPNSKLHLIIFEISAKDGSRQHELPILLN